MKITITETASGWCIESDGRFCSSLCRDEVIAFVAATMLDSHPLYGGLRTYEQTVSDRYWLRNREIAGLLTYQPHALMEMGA